jgi:phosphodiesterase/alkaline phosphatase D-like protein
MTSRTNLLLILGTLLLFASVTIAQEIKITKGPVVEHTTADSAIVAWSTNVSASTVVKYGTDRNSLSQTAQAPWGGLTHRVTIKDLDPGKTYFFQVDSGQGQGSGGNTTSDIGTFTTQGGSGGAAASGPIGQNLDQQFNIVNGPKIEQVTATGATVAWTTDRPASSVVKYGTDQNNLGQTAQEPWGATTHRVHIKNLQPGTQYYFSVHSAQGKNAPGQRADTAPIPFRTNDSGQSASNSNNGDFRITNGPVLERVGDTSAIVAWSTNSPSSSIVKYGTNPNNLGQSAQEAWGQTTHRVELKNLQPGTRYYFSVYSAQGKNAPGQSAKAGPMPFTTAQQGQAASVLQH